MSAGTHTNLVGVKVDGRPLPPTVKPLLVEAWVDTSVNVPAAFQLTFRDPHRRVVPLLNARIGAEVELRAYAAGRDGGKPIFTGEVTALEADFDATGKYTVLRGHDPSHRLLRNRRVAGYVNQTASDIARKLAARNGLKVGRIDSTKVVYEQISQANVTDWEFLARLARENDVEMYCDDEGKFRFVEPKPASGAPGAGTKAAQNHYVLEFGVNLLRCRTGITASDQVQEASARGWDMTAKRTLTARKSAARSPELAIGSTPGQAASAFGKATLTETEIPYDSQREVTGAADGLAADVSSAFAELEALVRGDPRLRPGLPVALNGIGRPFEGKYTVTAVRHMFSGGERYECLVTVSGEQHRSLFGLASGGGSTAPAPRLPGVAIALVTDVKDPRRLGRVKLRFPWLDEEYVSDWTRVMQFGGRRGGSLIMPEVNDEVLVAFDRGALDHPYVIGGLYNGIDRLPAYQRMPVVGAGGKINWRALASRTGNRLELRDAPGRKGVTLATGDDRMTIEMNQTGTRLSVDSKGIVTITGATAVQVRAGTNLALNAGGAVSISAGGSVNISAGGAVNTSAAGVLNLSAGGVLTAKAAGAVTVAGVSVALTGITTTNGRPF
ncbi:VgrG-related protein [Spirillospora sp. NPDC047418]